MLKARLIGSLIFAIIFCAIYYPMQTIGFFVILGIGYIIFLNLKGSINKQNMDYDRALRRRSALEVAADVSFTLQRYLGRVEALQQILLH